MRARTVALLATAVVLGAAAGCGSDDDSGAEGGRKTSTLVRLGIEGEAIDEGFKKVAETVGRPGVPDTGVAIRSFTERSQADEAGLADAQTGPNMSAVQDADIVVTIDGAPATVDALSQATAAKKDGDVATLVVVDVKGVERTVEVPYVADLEAEGPFIGG